MKRALPTLLLMTVMIGGAWFLSRVDRRPVLLEPPFGQNEKPHADPSAHASASAVASADPRATADFLARFGSSLRLELSPSGRLASVRGKLGEGMPAGKGFTSDDPRQAIARAREIINAAAPLLALDPRFPLGTPLARGDGISAEVEFPETYRMPSRSAPITVEPNAGVTVQLGTHGELVGLYSRYFSTDTIRSGFLLTGQQAQSKALPGLGVDGGTPILWTKASGGARAAYEFWKDGRQIIVDASSGAVLMSRDRRQY